MPLSDHEQRILDEIEKNLYSEDPAFARKRSSSVEDQRKRARLGALSFVAGVIGLFVFFSTALILVGVMAFAGMVLGIVLIAGAVRTVSPADLLRGPKERADRFLSDWEDKVRERRKKD